MLVQVEKYSPDRVLGAVDVSVTLSISTFSIEKALVFSFSPVAIVHTTTIIV